MQLFLKRLLLAGSAGLVMSVTASVYAQPLEDALALAYETNLELKAVRSELRAEDQLRAEARAARRPQVFISGSLTQNPSNFDNTVAGGTTTKGGHEGHVHKPEPIDLDVDTLDLLTTRNEDLVTKNIGVNVVQPIFEGFRIRNSIREADAHVSAGHARLMAAEQTLFMETIDAYLSVSATRDALALLRENVSLLTRQAETVEAALSDNRATQTDLAQARARLARAQARLIELEARQVESDVRFSSKVGQAPATLDQNIAIPELPPTLEDALAMAQNNNPHIAEASAEHEAAEYSVRVAKGKIQPSVNAVANYGQSYDSLFEGNDVENRSLSLQFSMPLYQGGSEYASIRRARHSKRAWGYHLEEEREEVENAVRAVWQKHLSAKAALAAANAAATENELALEGVRQENSQGTRTVLDVLNAESENLEAKLSVLELRQKVLMSAFELRELTGTLSAAALGLDVSLYDAESLSNRDARKWLGYGIKD
jgi:outer membrane protein